MTRGGYRRGLRSPALLTRLLAAPSAPTTPAARLAALLRAEGLDQDAHLLPYLFTELKLTPRRLARALRRRLAVIGTSGPASTSGAILAEYLKEGEPAIQAGVDWFRVVVLYEGEPLALGPMRELERNAHEDALRAAAILAPDDVPALGTSLEYRGPSLSYRHRGTLNTGTVGVVTERREPTESNPLGSALVVFPGGVRLVYRPHMKDAHRSFRILRGASRRAKG